MQNNTMSKEKNVFEQIKALFSGFFSGTGERVEGTYLDEATRIITPIIIVTAFARVITYTFALNFIFSWMGEYSIYAAVSLAFILELAIVFGGFALSKGIAYRETYFNLIQFIVVFFIAGVFGVGINWGLKMSTKGVEQIAKVYNESIKTNDSTSTLLGENIAMLDQGINGTNEATTKGGSIKWKGKITEDGAEIIKASQRNQGEILKQKTLLMQAKINRDATIQENKNFETKTKANWTGLLGGYLEVLSMFSVFALGFCKVGIEKHKRKLQDEQDNQEITVITGNYDIKNAKIEIDGKLYDRTGANQWRLNCIARAKLKDKTPEQKKYFLERAEQLTKAIAEYDLQYQVRGAAQMA